METFELYKIAWLVYSILGLIFLALISYKTRKLSWNSKFAIISFLAVGIFTPAIVTDALTFAPLAITALLDAEIHGSTVLIDALIRLLALWGVIFFSGLGIRHYLRTRRANLE